MHCYILVNIEAVHVLHGFTKRFKKKFFPHYKSMKANDPQGHGWDDLCRGSLDITLY